MVSDKSIFKIDPLMGLERIKIYDTTQEKETVETHVAETAPALFFFFSGSTALAVSLFLISTC